MVTSQSFVKDKNLFPWFFCEETSDQSLLVVLGIRKSLQFEDVKIITKLVTLTRVQLLSIKKLVYLIAKLYYNGGKVCLSYLERTVEEYKEDQLFNHRASR